MATLLESYPPPPILVLLHFPLAWLDAALFVMGKVCSEEAKGCAKFAFCFSTVLATHYSGVSPPPPKSNDMQALEAMQCSG